MKKLLVAAIALTSSLTFAQELKVSGVVDTYGTVNTVDGSGTPGILIANPQNANGFGLGSANTIFSYEGDKSGVVADLAFGPRANDANLAGPINQLYAYYNVNDKLKLTAGQFNTFLGYEVINPMANFNYTVSYLFNEGPFSHTGVKADYAISEDLSLMLAVTNGHAIASDDGNVSGNTQLGAQLGYKGQFLNFIYGSVDEGAPTDMLFVDYTGGFDLTDSFYVGINAAYANSSDADSGYQGAALYLQQKLSDTYTLGLRPEYFTRTTAGTDATVTALTLALNKNITDNFKIIAEARYDASDDKIIEGFEAVAADVANGIQAVAGEESVSSFTIGAVYSF